MTPGTVSEWLRGTESATPEERWAVLCFLAGRAVEIDEAELNGAIRRAELLLATGGDPKRPLELDGRAVAALADDLDAPGRRSALAGGLESLVTEVEGLGATIESLRLLRADPDLAWRAYVMSRLAEALADDT